MGVETETLKPGDGATFPTPGARVTCHYVLTLTDGKKIDSSRDRGQPFQFNIGKGEVSKYSFLFTFDCYFVTVCLFHWIIISGDCWLGRGCCQDVQGPESQADYLSWHGVWCWWCTRLYSSQLYSCVWCGATWLLRLTPPIFCIRIWTPFLTASAKPLTHKTSKNSLNFW